MEKRINLLEYRPHQSTSYSGRPQGEELRKVLNLNELDKSNYKIIFVVPSGTTSFNPSFFLGLLFKSIKDLGVEEFNRKYNFLIEDTDEDYKANLNDNIADGMRNAINSIKNVSALNFLNRKS